MKYFSLAVILGFLACCIQLGSTLLLCNNTNPCSNFFQEEAHRPFKEPVALESLNGELDVNLRAEMSDVWIQWLKLRRRTFNGHLEAPTWRVFPGDTVRVRVENRLGANPVNQTGHNTLHNPNTTNIHVHGMHISPEGNADNVFVEIDPGQTFQYVYDIPGNHPAGTYWYHPHFHGSGLFQTMSGMSGLIIVQDNPSDWQVPWQLLQVSCPEYCEHDIEMLMQPSLQYSADAVPVVFGDIQQEIRDDPLFRNLENITSGGTLADWLINRTNGVNYFTVNGDLQPNMYFRAGQMKRMRLANAGGAHALELEVRGVGRNNSCTFREIAFDGVYLDAPRVPRTGQTLVVPGGRADWMIRCDTPGIYEIVSNVKAENNPSMGTFDRFNGTLATITVWGPRVYRPPNFPTTLPPKPGILADLRNLAPGQPVDKFVIEMGPGNTLNREFLPANRSLQNRYSMQLNRVQEWTFVNANPVLLHPMHIHVNHFQVISYNPYRGPITVRQVLEQEEDFITRELLVDQNGQQCQFQWSQFEEDFPVPYNGSNGLNPQLLEYIGHEVRYVSGQGALAYAPVGDWRETISVPALGNITIRFVPRDFTGNKVIHCHNSAHGDRGMFMVTKVVNEGQSTSGSRVASDGNLAGTCHPGDFYPGVSTHPTTTPPPTTTTTTPAPTTMPMMRRSLTYSEWMDRFHPTYWWYARLRPNYFFTLYLNWISRQGRD